MRRIVGAAAGTLTLAAVVAGSSITAASASTTPRRVEHFQFMTTSAILAQGQRRGLGRIYGGRDYQFELRPHAFPARDIPDHSSPHRGRKPAQREDLPAAVGPAWNLPSGRRDRPVPAYQRKRDLHQPDLGRAQAQRQGAVHAVEAAPGAPAGHQRPRPGPRCVRVPPARRLGGAAPLRPVRPTPATPAAGPAEAADPAGQAPLIREVRRRAGAARPGRPRPPRGRGRRSAG